MAETERSGAGLTDREMLGIAWAVLAKTERVLPHTSIEWAEVATQVRFIRDHLDAATDPSETERSGELRHDIQILVEAVLGGMSYLPHREAAERLRAALSATPPDTDPSGLDVEAAWEALRTEISASLGRSNDTLFARHRPIIEAAIRAERPGIVCAGDDPVEPDYAFLDEPDTPAAIQESRAGDEPPVEQGAAVLMGIDVGYPMTGAGRSAAARAFLADHPEHARAIAAIEAESRAGGGLDAACHEYAVVNGQDCNHDGDLWDCRDMAAQLVAYAKDTGS